MADKELAIPLKGGGEIVFLKTTVAPPDRDRTVNTAGPGNRVPVDTVKPDGITALVDGMIRDGWLAPEDRWQQCAALYQRNLEVARQAARQAEARAAKREARKAGETAR